MKTCKFETEQKDWSFTIEAKDWDEAYATHGPQVKDMYYREITIDKGEFKGECNRTACTTKNAVFFNHSTRKYYCGSCAYEINKWAPRFRIEKGHDLCVKQD